MDRRFKGKTGHVDGDDRGQRVIVGIGRGVSEPFLSWEYWPKEGHFGEE